MRPVDAAHQVRSAQNRTASGQEGQDKLLWHHGYTGPSLILFSEPSCPNTSSAISWGISEQAPDCRSGPELHARLLRSGEHQGRDRLQTSFQCRRRLDDATSRCAIATHLNSTQLLDKGAIVGLQRRAKHATSTFPEPLFWNTQCLPSSSTDPASVQWISPLMLVLLCD